MKLLFCFQDKPAGLDLNSIVAWRGGGEVLVVAVPPLLYWTPIGSR